MGISVRRSGEYIVGRGQESRVYRKVEPLWIKWAATRGRESEKLTGPGCLVWHRQVRVCLFSVGS